MNSSEGVRSHAMPSPEYLDFSTLQTEGRNPRSRDIDEVSTAQLCRIINAEDCTVAELVKNCIPVIAGAVDVLSDRVRRGGRVIYVGAGTSGRLGVLDASEIPPTYSAPPHQFIALIAGGDVAIRSAVEGAEDSFENAESDLEALKLDGERDVLIGIAASGRTPYVLSSLAYAKAHGCATVGIACASPSPMSTAGSVDFMIEVVTGPEVITGSTRMKAGTATKLVLNMLSTGTMIRTGKTYGNIMVDVKPSNIKLQARARRILREICGSGCTADDKALDKIMKDCNMNVKLAAIVINLNISKEDARIRLDDAGGVLKHVLQPADPMAAVTKHLDHNEARRLYLCVDAGGSKCDAVIISNGKTAGLGQTGPCNITELGVDAAAVQIRLAIARASEKLRNDHGSGLQHIAFAGVWVAAAGGDRPGIRSSLAQALKDKIDLVPGAELRVMNDIELQALIAIGSQTAASVVVLVAGTGSVVMAFERSGNGARCIARVGGWGALLGDDGSGFSIGRQAIRSSLAHLQSCEETAGDGRMIESATALNDLTTVVLRHYGLDTAKSSPDLLDAILNPVEGDAPGSASPKQKIAGCTKAVIDASTSCAEAASLVSDAHNKLVHMVQSIAKKPGVNIEDSVLVMSGGLFSSNTFSKGLEQRLKSSGVRFRTMVHNHSPALLGAKALSETAG